MAWSQSDPREPDAHELDRVIDDAIERLRGDDGSRTRSTFAQEFFDTYPLWYMTRAYVRALERIEDLELKA